MTCALYCSLPVLVVLVTACGTAPSQESTSQGVDTDKVGWDMPKDEPEPREQVIEYRREGETTALAVDTSRDMPGCSLATNRTTVYVKDSDTYFVCDNEVWQEIEMRGPKASEPEEENEDAQDAAENEWTDPVTGERWFVGSQASVYFVREVQACSGPWKHPTKAEARDAVLHGITTKIPESSSTHVWTAEAGYSDPAALQYAIRLFDGAEEELSVQETARIVCLYVGED